MVWTGEMETGGPEAFLGAGAGDGGCVGVGDGENGYRCVQ